MGDPIELARIEEFSDGTAEGVRQLVELFLEDSRETLTAMITLMSAESDRARLSLLAHRLGGTCAAIGARRLSGQLSHLEQQAATLSSVELASVMAMIEAELDSAIGFLSAYLEGRRKS